MSQCTYCFGQDLDFWDDAKKRVMPSTCPKCHGQKKIKIDRVKSKMAMDSALAAFDGAMRPRSTSPRPERKVTVKPWIKKGD